MSRKYLSYSLLHIVNDSNNLKQMAPSEHLGDLTFLHINNIDKACLKSCLSLGNILKLFMDKKWINLVRNSIMYDFFLSCRKNSRIFILSCMRQHKGIFQLVPYFKLWIRLWFYPPRRHSCSFCIDLKNYLTKV